MASGSNSLMWFRKGIRIHDNPALEYAAKGSDHLFPVFVIDPHYMEPDPNAFSPGSERAGLNRIRFLLESLVDLDLNLRKLGSRLLVLKGEPSEVLFRCLKEWSIKKLCFEFDTDPYYQALDDKMKVSVHGSLDATVLFGLSVSHNVPGRKSRVVNSLNVYYTEEWWKTTFELSIFCQTSWEPSWASSPISTEPNWLPPVGNVGNCPISEVPSINELGYEDTQVVLQDALFLVYEVVYLCVIVLQLQSFMDGTSLVGYDPGASTNALLDNKGSNLLPQTLPDYTRYFYQCILEVQRNSKRHTSPPVSLLGQLLWREFFYTVAFGTPNFDQMKDNRICKQIPWKDDDDLLSAWRDARTGFPWIDAIMVQLRKWGWVHHLARHCVACFLTRGDLFVHWEKGRDVFERLLIDSDWAINNANWLWLSCSSFFFQYNRIYSPISFGKKYDPNGNYIRHFLPILRGDLGVSDMPKEYIYEPWTAPLSIQVKAKCIIGKDYPNPVVAHDIASKECRQRLYEAYELNKRLNGKVGDEDLKSLRRKLEEDKRPESKSKRLKQTLIG
ncbi:hypothetical protein DH2020_041086 [Rehmannia glutinosa]|uniref:Photolyase/cryptochrome alpha/beta domain-containing protein n=1 Tax=Rehmannia glutinosa TaxID=99300 RepID=A0ABR0USN7_REHGL